MPILEKKIDSKIAIIIICSSFLISLFLIVFYWQKLNRDNREFFTVSSLSSRPKKTVLFLAIGIIEETREDEIFLRVQEELKMFKLMPTTIFFEKSGKKNETIAYPEGIKKLEKGKEIMIIYQILEKNLFLAEEIWI